MPQKPRILIVDDDPIAAEALADVVAKGGHPTATAVDGREALELLSKDPGAFAILITELNLPRMDGLTLLRALRKAHASIVPIVITGYAKIETAVEAVKLGAVDYLVKPVVDDELRLALDKAANQHALVAENATLKSQLSERFGLGSLI